MSLSPLEYQAIVHELQVLIDIDLSLAPFQLELILSNSSKTIEAIKSYEVGGIDEKHKSFRDYISKLDLYSSWHEIEGQINTFIGDFGHQTGFWVRVRASFLQLGYEERYYDILLAENPAHILAMACANALTFNSTLMGSLQLMEYYKNKLSVPNIKQTHQEEELGLAQLVEILSIKTKFRKSLLESSPLVNAVHLTKQKLKQLSLSELCGDRDIYEAIKREEDLFQVSYKEIETQISQLKETLIAELKGGLGFNEQEIDSFKDLYDILCRYASSENSAQILACFKRYSQGLIPISGELLRIYQDYQQKINQSFRQYPSKNILALYQPPASRLLSELKDITNKFTKNFSLQADFCEFGEALASLARMEDKEKTELYKYIFGDDSPAGNYLAKLDSAAFAALYNKFHEGHEGADIEVFEPNSEHVMLNDTLVLQFKTFTDFFTALGIGRDVIKTDPSRFLQIYCIHLKSEMKIKNEIDILFKGEKIDEFSRNKTLKLVKTWKSLILKQYLPQQALFELPFAEWEPKLEESLQSLNDEEIKEIQKQIQEAEKFITIYFHEPNTEKFNQALSNLNEVYLRIQQANINSPELQEAQARVEQDMKQIEDARNPSKKIALTIICLLLAATAAALLIPGLIPLVISFAGLAVTLSQTLGLLAALCGIPGLYYFFNGHGDNKVLGLAAIVVGIGFGVLSVFSGGAIPIVAMAIASLGLLATVFSERICSSFNSLFNQKEIQAFTKPDSINYLSSTLVANGKPGTSFEITPQICIDKKGNVLPVHEKVPPSKSDEEDQSDSPSGPSKGP